MQKKKIRVALLSNYSRSCTGFGKNVRLLLTSLHKDDRFEVYELSNGMPKEADLKLPWPAFGTFNNELTPRLNPEQQRANSYGFYESDRIIEEIKPDIFIGIEDIWAFRQYEQKWWWDKVNTILWTTLDSLPIIPDALHLAPKCNKFFTWASFAEKEMKKLGHKNVKTLPGAVDTSNFYPLKNRDQIRAKFGLQNNFVVGFVFRNQLRKSLPNLMEGFKKFKNKCPESNPKLLLLTDWSERGSGWDIPRFLEEKKMHEDVLAVYVCHKCYNYFVINYQGEDKDCPVCRAEKTVKTKTCAIGISEEQLNETYNMMDVYCHPFSSGGMELPLYECGAAGVPKLVTSYSCGLDCCNWEQGGLPLDWAEYREPGTQFQKATTLPESICSRLEEVYRMTPEQKRVLSENGINFSREYCSVEKVADRLKKELLEFDKVDWEEIEIPKKEGDVNFEDFLDDEGQENRICVVLPESNGDLLILNSLMENLHNLYPEKNIYVMTKPESYCMIDDNQYVHKLIPYSEQADNLLFLEGRGEWKGYFEKAFLPGILTQVRLGYLHGPCDDKYQFDLYEEKTS